LFEDKFDISVKTIMVEDIYKRIS